MKIVRVESWRQHVPLARPYAISSGTTDAVELFFVRVVGEREIGLGSASPIELITGESIDACAAALEPARLDWLAGRDATRIGELCEAAAELLGRTPAARAALDTALFDHFARTLHSPLVDLLGRRCGPLATSVTVGIQPIDQALAQVDEVLGRGFRRLKVKLGRSIDEDLARLRAIRARAGPEVPIRVDANEGYDLEATLRLGAALAELDLELVEQPLPRARDADLARLPPELRGVLALDESVHDEADARAHARRPGSCAAFVVKLMKCGGVSPALSIAEVAAGAGRDLMWGCMDESAVSIAAALHAAYASSATRYLDLDGSFDLARDPAEGGFRLVDGELHVLDEPGLGVRLGD